jgi:hypothetical protein
MSRPTDDERAIERAEQDSDSLKRIADALERLAVQRDPGTWLDAAFGCSHRAVINGICQLCGKTVK